MCLSIYNFICRHFTTMSTSLPLGSNFFLQSTTFLTLPSSCPPASGTLKILFPWMKSRVYALKNKTWRHLRTRKISQRKTKPKKPPWKKQNLRFVTWQNNAINILQITFIYIFYLPIYMFLFFVNALNCDIFMINRKRNRKAKMMENMTLW